MRFLRILPEVWARIVWSLSSFTRNLALGSSSDTTPVNSIRSSLAIRPPVGIEELKRPENGLWKGFSQLDQGIAFPYTSRGCGRPRKEGPVVNERTSHVQPSGRRPHPGFRIRYCPDADARAGRSDGGCERTQDDRRADQSAIFVGTDRAQRQGRPPGRRQAD